MNGLSSQPARIVQQEALGNLVARTLSTAWREHVQAADLSEAELAQITSLLCRTGSAALGWWKIRSQKSEVRGQKSEIRGQRSEIGDQRWEFDRGAVTDSSRGLSAQRDTPGNDGRDGSDPEGVEAAKAMLHDAYRQFRLSALVHEQEIKHIFSLLRAEGIEPVLVKGWAIARHYPDRGLRPYGDIDLCVRPDQFAAAARALKSLENLDGHYVDLHEGFAKLELATRFSAPSRRLLRLGGEPDGQKTHRRGAEWREVSQRGRAFRLPTLVGPFSTRKSPTEVGTLDTALWDELFERSHLVSLGSPRLGRESPARDVNHRGAEDPEEIKVRVLCDEDHLRILCLHLLRSGAWRPLWLCDVAVALETRAADFDWDRCLTSDPKIAEWVAGTIGLAQELLGAESGRREAVSGEAKALTSYPLPLSASRLPLRASRLPHSASRLPHWLAPAVLRQWGRSLNPQEVEPALLALSSRKRDARKFFREMYARWDQPVRATVALRGRFDNRPRWPYQLAELLLHGAELPKQLALMFRQSFTPKALDSSAQSEALGTGFSQTIPHPEGV